VTLANSVAVVTGASSGIGRALALALAREGASVWALGRDRSRLESLLAEASHEGKDIQPIVVDLERRGDIESAVSTLRAAHAGVDVLVHAAGALALGNLGSLSPSDLDRQCAVNLRAPVILTQLLLEPLRRARGQVVFVNSLAAFSPTPTNTVYAATKAALKTFADGLRAEVNADGVRVLTVHPGRTATPLQEAVHEYEGRPYATELLLQPADIVDIVLASLMLPRNGEVTDVSLRTMAKLPPL
jgi:short-subunit dehydrogenase